jgi:ABC-type glycerol-3-phosphate transport system substrate-binding protein
LGLTACGGGGGSGNNSGGQAAKPATQAEIDKAMQTPTKLTFWTWVPNIAKEVALFEKKYPAIQVSVVNAGQGPPQYTKLRTALKAGTGAPDVAQIEFQYIPTFSITKDLVDLRPYGAEAQKAKFVDWTWSQVSFGEQGHVYAIPQDAGPMALFYRKDLFDQIGAEPPKTADDMLALGKQLTDAKAGRWAFGSVADEMARAFGAPYKWRKQPDGTLIHKHETDEYAQAIEWCVEAFKSGLVHPTVVENKNADAKQLFTSGQLLMHVDGPGSWHELLQQQQTSNPSFQMAAFKPFAAKSGGTNLVWQGEPAGMYVFIKKDLGEDRTKELLRVANFASAPFGTEEFELMQYGVRDKHFKVTPQGPQFTPLGTKEAASPTYYFIGGHVPEITESGLSGYVQAMAASPDGRLFAAGGWRGRPALVALVAGLLAPDLPVRELERVDLTEPSERP